MNGPGRPRPSQKQPLTPRVARPPAASMSGLLGTVGHRAWIVQGMITTAVWSPAGEAASHVDPLRLAAVDLAGRR
jgi:hypothetical protein